MTRPDRGSPRRSPPAGRLALAPDGRLGALHLVDQLLLHQLASDRALRAPPEAGDLRRIGAIQIESHASTVADRQDARDDLQRVVVVARVEASLDQDLAVVECPARRDRRDLFD